jgi:hypothetical protein
VHSKQRIMGRYLAPGYIGTTDNSLGLRLFLACTGDRQVLTLFLVVISDIYTLVAWEMCANCNARLTAQAGM